MACRCSRRCWAIRMIGLRSSRKAQYCSARIDKAGQGRGVDIQEKHRELLEGVTIEQGVNGSNESAPESMPGNTEPKTDLIAAPNRGDHGFLAYKPIQCFLTIPPPVPASSSSPH